MRHPGRKYAAGAPNATQEATDQVLSGRLATAKASADQCIKHLEEENATLRGANADLHAQLKRYQHLNDHLASRGPYLVVNHMDLKKRLMRDKELESSTGATIGVDQFFATVKALAQEYSIRNSGREPC